MGTVKGNGEREKGKGKGETEKELIEKGMGNVKGIGKRE